VPPGCSYAQQSLCWASRGLTYLHAVWTGQDKLLSLQSQEHSGLEPSHHELRHIHG